MVSKKVKLSSPSVAERIQKKEDVDIINGYSANLNMEKRLLTWNLYFNKNTIWFSSKI